MTTIITGVQDRTTVLFGAEIDVPPQGPIGPQGLSAYQVWLAAGNTGTIGQFLASLVGPTGPASTVPGPQGNPTTVNGKTGASITLALSDLAPGALPTTLPSTAGVLWNNGGVVQVS